MRDGGLAKVGHAGETIVVDRGLADDEGWRWAAELVPHLVWVARPDGSTEYLNQRMVAFTGLSADQTFGWHLVQVEDRARAMDAWHRSVSTLAVYEIDYRVRDAKGQYRWVVARAAPIHGPGGEVLRWMGTWTDIDGLRQLEDELRLAEVRAAAVSATLDALEVTAPVGFALLDRDLRVVRLNEAVASINGVSVEAAPGRHIAEIAPDQWPRVEPSYRRVLDTGESIVNVDVDRVDAAGRARRWLVSFYPVRVDGDVVGVGVAGIDITDRGETNELGLVMHRSAEGRDQPESERREAFDNDGRLLGRQRVARLEGSLRRIAQEVEASGVVPEFKRVDDTERIPNLNTLSDREREVVNRLLRGERVPGIAKALFVSQSTVRNHLTHAFRKLGVHSQEQLLELFHG